MKRPAGKSQANLPPAIWLQVLNEDGYSSTIKDKILTIDVKPGWRQGTRITFEKEGDQVRRREVTRASPSVSHLGLLMGGKTEGEGGDVFCCPCEA